mmetsp:Transcript_9643/g.15818  ORF Transcript_9643/g.15818 Transcript_9643/m.15818 type:complete len:102 (+) Transcript_9643:1488-1793(+)
MVVCTKIVHQRSHSCDLEHAIPQVEAKVIARPEQERSQSPGLWLTSLYSESQWPRVCLLRSLWSLLHRGRGSARTGRPETAVVRSCDIEHAIHCESPGTLS